jgi:hypothetical protein
VSDVSLAFPKQAEIFELIEMLIGEKPLFKKGPAWDLKNPSDGCYITFLQGKDNEVEGAVITDLAATLYIGGKLIMLQPAALQNQYYSGEAEDSVVEAVTEVINNLRTLFNAIDLNPHVAPTKTFLYQVPSEDDFVAWVLKPGKRVDYTGKTPWGDGTITLIAP